MEKAIKFLGICILLTALIVNATSIIEQTMFDRYEIINIGTVDKAVFDKNTGKLCYYWDENFTEIDYVNKTQITTK